MARVDYWNDPHAPAANSLVVAASAIVTDGRGQVVLQRRTDNDQWALPGGGMNFGESIRQTTIREVHEETGLTVEAEYIVAVYSDPSHVFAYDDGEVRQEFSVCVKCNALNGDLRPGDESTDVAWFPTGDLAKITMHPRIRARIDDYLAGKRAGLNP